MNSEPSQRKSEKTALPAELHAATRRQHHALNEQILLRLPLCLPPVVESPLVYAKGMVVFGQIYCAFEHVLAACANHGSLDPRLQEICRQVRLLHLLRTTHLEKDMGVLKSRLGFKATSELDVLALESKVFHDRIISSLAAKPHAVLAYAWTMYLALFNGGRWIQRQLVSAGPGFWRGEDYPLSFWELDEGIVPAGAMRDLKATFKEALLVAASLPTDEEKDDIVEEATRLFDLCQEMVHFLDNKVTAAATTTVPIEVSITSYWIIQGFMGATSLVLSVWRYMASTYTLLRTTARSVWDGRVVHVD